MSFDQKTWLDRVSEYPMRRQLTDESGNVSLVTLERSDGEVSVEGDMFSADNLNNLEQRIADGVGATDANVSAIKTSINNLFSYDSSNGRLVINLDAL